MTALEDQTVYIVGAGIVGICSAIYLQNAGRRVIVIDGSQPGSGASFGNGGMLSVDSFSPMAMPGMVRNVPKWLADPLGPLALRPSYLPKVAPWLLRWIAASRMSVVRSSAQALRSLNSQSMILYRELLGDVVFRDLITAQGSLQVWESEAVSKSQRVAASLRAEFGVEAENLTGDQCRDLVPELSPNVLRGIYFPRNGHTTSPSQLIQALVKRFHESGGKILQERVLRIVPNGDGGAILWTEIDNHVAKTLIVAAGAYANELLAPINVSLPLEAERGYHINAIASFAPRMPILHPDFGIGVTPMSEGVRIAGTVELSGVRSPADEKRADALLLRASSLFPAQEILIGRRWVGSRPSLPRSVPVIGQLPGVGRLYAAVGHGHYGMMAAPATGKLLAEIVTGQPPSVDPEQFSFQRAWQI